MNSSKIKINENTKVNFFAKLISETSKQIYIKIIDVYNNAVLFEKKEFSIDKFEFIKFDLKIKTEIIIEIYDPENILSLEYFVIYDESLYKKGTTYLDYAKGRLRFIEHDLMPDYYAENEYRNQFHYSPFKGWINDPNGLIYYKGYYHMFCQHYPHTSSWGNMHWAHAVSKDLIHWKHFPIAMIPGDNLDNEHVGGIFSGNAIEHDNKMYLFYTDHFENKKDNSIFIEKQAFATSIDGINFEQYEGNPVLSEKPAKASKDFRDPKVFKDLDGLWKMILGGGYNGLPSVLIFSSQDLISWKYEGPLYQEKSIPGRAIECPDFFDLGDKHVLLMSVFQEDGENRNYFTRYIVGNYKNNRFTSEHIGIMDFGIDFYATQTFVDDKNRRIGIAWIENWTSHIKSQKYGFAGAMSLPREFYLDNDNKLRSKPVDEVKLLRKTKNPLYSKSNFTVSDNKKMINMQSNCFELQVKALLETCSIFKLKLRCGDDNDQFIEIIYDEQKKQFSIINIEENDRSEYSTTLNSYNPGLELRIFADRSCLEVFVNDYEVSGTVRMYIKPENQDIELISSEKTVIETFRVWELKSSW